MRSRRGLLAVLMIALMSLLVAGPAAAGGPTSVLLVDSGTGRTASLHIQDADYVQLSDLVGAFEPGGTADPAPSGTPSEDRAAVTMTWLIHDVSVWRVDRVYLDAPGGPWISTQTDPAGTGNLLERPGSWQKVARGKELSALLDRLGVGSRSATATSTSGATGAAVPVRTVAAATAPPPPAPSSGAAAWAIGGLAVGVAATLAGLAGSRLVRRWTQSGRRTPRRAAPST